MSYSWGKTSKERMKDGSPELIKLLDAVIVCPDLPHDMAVVSVFRGELLQNEAYRLGHSGVKFPDSSHNKMPSPSADLCPWIDGRLAWENTLAFYENAAVILQVARREGIELRRWPLTFVRNGKTVLDLPHWQVVEFNF